MFSRPPERSEIGPESWDTLDQIFRESPSFMAFTVGPDHKFELANPKFYEMLQLPGTVVGKTVAQVFPEIAAQGFPRWLDDTYRTGKPFRTEEASLLLDQPNGKKRELFVTFVYQPIRDATGQVYGILHQGFDVTEIVRARRQLERSKAAIENERENFRNLFRQTPEMVCILKGPEHVFEFVNEAHIRVLGFNATGMSVREAQPESVEVHGILDDVYRTGKTAQLHELPVTVGDRLRHFNVTYAARCDEESRINGIMVLGVEVTSQVAGREGLKKALAMRDDFLSIASHELRTPITSLQLQAQLLSRKVSKGAPISPEMLEKHLGDTQVKINELMKLVEDMLDVTRINSGRISYEFSDCDLKALVLETVASLADHFDAAGAVITVAATEARVRGDQFRLKQVLTNLLTNALKYGNGKPVHVSLSQEGGSARIEISDQGIGIAPENLARIFGRFERAIPYANVSGLGLGLFISEQIVRAHEGTISVTSELGRGSTFRVLLPLAEA